MIKFPAPSHSKLTQKLWVLKEDSEKGWQWKNEILIKWQKGLIAHGVTDEDHLRLYVQMMMQESGINVMPVGDRGCSFGLLQKNVCSHTNQNVQQFLNVPANSQWKEADYQLSVWIPITATKYKEYDGNIQKAIVHHNRPQSVINPKVFTGGLPDSCRYVGSPPRFSCYFRDEVSNKKHERKLVSVPLNNL